MKRIFLILLMAGVTLTVQAASKNNNDIVCKQPYALCTTAVCLPMPGNSSQALCFCNVFDGYSYGNTSCAARKPAVGPKGTETVVSTFSFKDYATNARMICKSGTPWTFCLDKPCIIDPRNSNQAICSCDIVRKGEYLTFGGECDTSTCGNTLYSGASIPDLNQAAAVLMKIEKLTKSPVRICPNNTGN